MKEYSKTNIYKNGNAVALYPSDHKIVRGILATGIVERVNNFGPLLKDKQVKANQVITSGDYELHVVNIPEVHSFGLGQGLTTSRNVNHVYYQRISH